MRRPTFQDRPSLLSLSTSLWQTALTGRHCLLHSCSLSSMMWCHSLQVREAQHRLSASSSLKIFTLISGGSASAKFWGVLSGPEIREGRLPQSRNTGEVLVKSCCIITPDSSKQPANGRIQSKEKVKQTVDHCFSFLWLILGKNEKKWP